MLYISLFLPSPHRSYVGGYRASAQLEHSGWLGPRGLEYLLFVHNFHNSTDNHQPISQRNSTARITTISPGDYGLLTFLKPGLQYMHCYMKIN